MRPLFRALAMPLLALALLLGMASVAQASDTVVLATESFDEPPGPEPGEANAEENEFRPADYEQNFLWGAAVGLGVLTLAGAGALGGLYWLLVVRPSQQSSENAKG